jgi:hypothetical protein
MQFIITIVGMHCYGGMTYRIAETPDVIKVRKISKSKVRIPVTSQPHMLCLFRWYSMIMLVFV